MKTLDIASLRLQNQRLIGQVFTKPEEVVRWMGALQAQDFAAAKWAVGIRLNKSTDWKIEEAFNSGKILRTHVMRPTWHFVHPADIRWLLALTSPRVHAFNGHYYRKSGLDKTIFRKSNEIIARALQGGKQLTRHQLDNVLRANGVPTKNLGLSYTMMQAELDGIICSGPRKGKQFTYMLLDERVPKVKIIDRDHALSELIKRYFSSRGPAQIQDFVWWSGLTSIDAKKGIAMNKTHLFREDYQDKTYWFFKPAHNNTVRGSIQSELRAALLPAFDEYFIAYKDRGAILDGEHKKFINAGGGMLSGVIVIRGKVVGTWKRTFQKNTAHINIRPFFPFDAAQTRAVNHAAETYGKFLQLSVVLYSHFHPPQKQLIL